MKRMIIAKKGKMIGKSKTSKNFHGGPKRGGFQESKKKNKKMMEITSDKLTNFSDDDKPIISKLIDSKRPEPIIMEAYHDFPDVLIKNKELGDKFGKFLHEDLLTITKEDVQKIVVSRADKHPHLKLIFEGDFTDVWYISIENEKGHIAFILLKG